MSMSSHAMGEKKCCGDSGGVECDCHEMRADTTVRWTRSESSGIKKDHDDKCSARTWQACKGRPSGIVVCASLLSSCHTS
jgi:hypothetical protein